MTGRAVSVVLAVLLGGTLTACGEHHFEPPDREARVAQADTAFTTVHFDSIEWQSDSIRALQGNVVYSARCRQCHGQLGRGQTEYARSRDITVPSLVSPDWPLPPLDSLRHLIFVGHSNGMPTWGIAGISPREIDAAAYYVLFSLRPEVLGEGGSGG